MWMMCVQFLVFLKRMYTKRYIIDLKIRTYFEKKILSEITVADVRAWQNELLMYTPTYRYGDSCSN